jgi:xylan 1,4-beta-xylosidase
MSAPYILDKLKRGSGLLQGMSYWTYSDIFYESGPPPSPFHGGFGLMNVDGIRKPAWFAYRYLHALSGREVPAADAETMAASDGRRTGIMFWNWELPDQKTSDRPYFTKVHPAQPARPARVQVSHLSPGAYRLTIHRTGFKANDPQTRYLEMGSPAALNPQQVDELQQLTRDIPETSETVRVGRDGRFSKRVPMRTHDVILLQLDRIDGPVSPPKPGRGERGLR